MRAVVVFLLSSITVLQAQTSLVQPSPEPVAPVQAFQAAQSETLQSVTPASASRLGAQTLIQSQSAQVNAGPIIFPNRAELYLSDLDAILSSVRAPLDLHLCFPGLTELGEDHVVRGAAVVQGIALRAGNTPVTVSYGSQLNTQGVNVVIGTIDKMYGLMSAEEIARIQYGYIALRRMAGRADGLVLIVTGRTSADLENTILSLGLVRQGYPEASYASIREVLLPNMPPFFRRDPLYPDSTYTFEQLAEKGAGLSVPQSGGLQLELFLPGDFPVSSDAKVNLNLHFVLKSRAFRSANSVLIRVNDVDQTKVSGSGVSATPVGGSEATVEIPFKAFKPGRNILQITTASLNKGRAVVDDLKVYSDSVLTIPKAETILPLPNLKVTSSTFYPFIGQPDGSDLAILLTDRNPQTIQSAWMFLGRLAQAANTFFYAAQITFSDYDSTRHVVVVGNYEEFPAQWRDLVPFNAFQEVYASTPIAQLNQAASGTNLKQLIENWRDKLLGRQISDAEKDGVKPIAKDVRQELAYLTCSPPIEKKHQWALILTAFSPDLLLERTRSLIQEDYWKQLDGDIVRWGKTPESFDAHVPTGEPSVFTTRSFVEMPLGERIGLWWWISLVVVTIFVFLVVTTRVLGKFDQMITLRQRRP